MPIDLSHPDLAHLLRWVQDGVLARRQILEAGGTDADIARMVRRRELALVHRGVYVNHTGPLTYAQREWVAVFAAWPAALGGESAIPGRRPGVIEVAVDHGRRVQPPSRVRVRRTARLAAKVRPGSLPPRVEPEHALIEVMSRYVGADNVAGAFTVLADACFTRETSPARILQALESWPRVPCRATIQSLVRDVRDGACSVLERGYLHRVERAHGLPPGRRQVRSMATGRRTVRDVTYEDFATVVELDGLLGHSTTRDRDRDSRRDLAEAAVSDTVTLRVTYGLVFDDPCATASRIGLVLQRRGWNGVVAPCAACRG